MNATIGWMAVGLFTIIVGMGIFSTNLLNFSEKVKDCLYPKGNTQDLVTECQLDEKLKVKKEKKWDGYFYVDRTEIFAWVTKKGECRVVCRLIDSTKTEYKVEYEKYNFDFSSVITTKWLPKKDFHKYYTTEELSEIVNKKGAGR